MGAFGGLILTNKGRALQAKVEAGAQLNFNRIAVGDGDLNGQSITDLNALISEKKSLSITKLKTQSTNQAVVGAVLSNQDIVTGFYFKELGVFAQDPDVGEILFCYGNAGANAEYIPAGGGADVVEKHIDCVTIVGNNANVTATMDQSLIYIAANEKGSSGGVATLDNSGSVPGTQLGNISSVNYGEATGTANTYAVTLTPTPTAYVDGMLVSVKINVDATGASTLNVNGIGAKAIKKANGNDVTNLKANGVYTFRYNATTENFILQGEGGSGTAQPGDVLNGKTFSNDAGDQTGTLALSGTANASDVISGKTFYNTDAKTKVTGTIPNNGSLGTITPGTANQTIPSGYTSGGTVAGDADLVSANIRGDKNIFGVQGSIPIQATAAQTVTPGTANIVKAAGIYDGDLTIVGDADLVSANIKSGANIFGVAGKSSVVETADATAAAGSILSGKTAYVNGAKVTGSIPSVGASTITPGTANKTAIATGNYASGTISVAGDPDLLAANIKSGVDIFGVVGSLIDGTNMKKYASGTATSSTTNYIFNTAITGSSYDPYATTAVVVSGLSFTPSIVIVAFKGTGAWTSVKSPLPTYYYSGSNIYMFLPNGSYTSNEIVQFKGDTYDANVSNGFCLPVSSSGQQFNWIAIE